MDLPSHQATSSVIDEQGLGQSSSRGRASMGLAGRRRIEAPGPWRGRLPAKRLGSEILFPAYLLGVKAPNCAPRFLQTYPVP